MYYNVPNQHERGQKVTNVYTIITFCSGWYGMLSPRGKVLLPEVKPRATVPFRGEIICHITLNNMWQLFYYVILWKKLLFDNSQCRNTRRFLPCDIACDSSKYHRANWPIRRQERQCICNKLHYSNSCIPYIIIIFKWYTKNVNW